MHNQLVLGPLVLATFLFSAGCQAAQRTFVSSSGNDANTASNCSLVYPCRSFGAALTVVDTGGEIIVLDSGSYAPVTIGKSVSLIAPRGVFAGIPVTSSHGVEVTASSAKVVLRGLTFFGDGATTMSGIRLSGTSNLTVENCRVSRTQVGLEVAATGTPKIRVSDSLFEDNGYGMYWVNGYGTISRTHLLRNSNDGLYAFSASGSSHIELALFQLISSQNAGRGLHADAFNGGYIRMDLKKVLATQNSSDGFFVQGSNNSTAEVSLVESQFAGNASDGLEGFAGNSSQLRVHASGLAVSGNADSGIDVESYGGGVAKVSAHNAAINANGTDGIYGQTTLSGAVLQLHVMDASLSDNASRGFQTYNTDVSSSLRASITDSLVSRNVGDGIKSAGNGGLMIAARNKIFRNDYGLTQSLSGTLESDGYNAVYFSTTSSTSGTVGSFLPM